ncbi:hypothetical protein GLA29479_235 [Lysobacter antibioticus]|uniref:hypothetical protein n=1 Tax=Lysobacter antibioticus TaxID=84531 RepID=UPI0007173B7D|nr:hypothetical protein [Lysobacter antibioticus]ALN61121.1 hypothetical protein GLA29479_235 [Lysobacter antibioticus]
MSAPVGRWLLIAAAVAIAAAVTAAIVVMGGPGAQREAKLDQRRTQELDRINDEVRDYWKRQARLPADLPSLAKQPGVALSTADPVTAAPYRYVAGEAGRFRLCASFATDTGREDAGRRAAADGYPRGWRHPAGEHCFELDASKPEG